MHERRPRTAANGRGLAHREGVDMLYVSSSNADSPERILIARESGHNPTLGKNSTYLIASDDMRFIDAARKLSENGSILYAMRLADGLIKIGWTSNLITRWRWLKSRYQACEFLAFTFGTRQDETALHKSLAEHVAHGREFYNATPEVLAIVNDWRAVLGRQPVAA